MKSVMLFKSLIDDKIQCLACRRKCLLEKGQVGFCGVRKNVNGRLKLLVYSLPSAVNIDPIEKKPLFHFYPGSLALSIGTSGCNFACKFCQNYDLSQRIEIEGERLSPSALVKIGMKYNVKVFSYTYNEPTIFIEFAYEIGRLARKKGMKNTFVTNGYQTEEAIELMKKFIDAVTVDFKANGDPKFYLKNMGVPKGEEIYQNLKMMKEAGFFIEITDLVIPKLGDDLENCKKLCRWILENLGENVPIHFLRFFPHYLFTDLDPTPIETLEKHAKIAREEGLKFVYIGNVPGHELENTYCPYCGEVVIKRFGINVLRIDLDGRSCKYCGKDLPIVI
ncbi:MAG: AmmeMemoRadiSam system radical SAM enzyme [Candidatus Aenigmarchaeota archaeon]|nr:AmmeMemoRadiSam system radical SAM enzyme [Candidatus Aenigmarchaeota archaeon]